MMRLLSTALLAALCGLAVPGAAAAEALQLRQQEGTAPSPGERALLPDTLLAPPSGPRLVLLGTPGSGVAALRLHVPLVEGPAEAGVGSLLAELNQDRMVGLARPVGARVAASRTPWGLSYAVEGAAADFEYLAYLLREAASRPDVDDIPLTRARQRLAAAVARDAETPAGRLARELRAALEPGTPPLSGTPATLETLGPGRVLEAWRRSHKPSRMTLVVSAGVLPEVVLAATRGLGTTDPADPGPLDAPPPPEADGPPAQSLRVWYGRGWSGGSVDSPLGPVTALLLADALEAADDGDEVETTLQLRRLRTRWALTVLGAAYPSDAGAMRSRVRGALEALEARLDEEAVAAAAARVRRDLLYRARTPLGLVEVVGRAMEPGAEPGAAARYLEALDAVDGEAVRAFLAILRAGPDASGEVAP